MGANARVLHHKIFASYPSCLYFLQDCTEKDPPCPIILLERFGFEMKKGYKETQLQLLLSPAVLLSSDKLSGRSSKEKHLNQGHLMLSGCQVS